MARANIPMHLQFSQVINLYLELLSSPHCHFCNTNFYSKLTEVHSYVYAKVRRWTKKAS